MKEKQRQMSLAVQVLIGLAILFFILHSLNLEKLIEVFSRTNLLFLGLGVLAYLTLNLINTFKLGLFVHVRENISKFKELFFINLAGMLASDVTPGRAGYFYTIILLKDKIRKARGTAALMAFQLTELLVKVIGALVAFFFFINSLSNTKLSSYFFLAFALVVIGIVFIVLISFSQHSTLLFRWSKRFFPSFLAFQEHARATKRVFVLAFFMTLVGWFIRGSEWFFVAHAVGLNLGLFQAILLHPFITIFAFVPVSIAGLGIVEFAGITVVGNMGVAPMESAAETVLAFLLLDRVMNIFVDLLGLKRLVRL